LCNDSLCSRPPYAPEQWREELATSCVIEDDFTVYRFTIRDGVFWQRPTFAGEPGFEWLNKDVPLTAGDFAFTLDLLMDPAVDCPSQRAYYEQDLASWKAIDDHTFEIRWKNKVFTSLASSMGLQPTPRHIYGRNADGSEISKERLGVTFNKHWFDERRAVVGVGAYQLTSFEPEQKMVFVKNPRYWGVSDHFERREWILNIKDPEAELTAFKNGQVQAFRLSALKYKSEIIDGKEERFAPIDPKDPKAGRSGPFGWERVKSMSFTYIGWNMRKRPFDDQRVRQAMSYAFPKERIIRDVYFGLGQGVLSDVHPDSQYYNHNLKAYPFDLTKAKALLAEAGWADTDKDGLLDRTVDGKQETFTFELKYYANSPEWDNTLTIYRQELRKLGIDMTPRPYEWSELVRIYEDKDFVAVVGGWRMGWDLDYFQLWHSSQIEAQGSSNFCGFSNPRVDELADKLRATFETSERIAIVMEIQSIINEVQPYTFFKSGEGIFIWQNHPAKGMDDAKDRYLRGVVTGLESFHPLANRTNWFWHFAN
jgi:peptide/nickel transport system substrate-binding protein